MIGNSSQNKAAARCFAKRPVARRCAIGHAFAAIVVGWTGKLNLGCEDLAFCSRAKSAPAASACSLDDCLLSRMTDEMHRTAATPHIGETGAGQHNSHHPHDMEISLSTGMHQPLLTLIALQAGICDAAKPSMRLAKSSVQAWAHAWALRG